MPRPLTIADNQLTLSNWLQTEISNMDFPFTPHVSHLNAIPEKRGIYFWFMDTKGLEKLSRYVQIDPVENRISWQIEGKTYDLVYLGTAGTKRKGTHTLKDRLRWHINQQHQNSAICHGTLSTLRTGLSALLSDDLIHPNTERLVNELMEDCFKVFWVEYIEDDILDQINQDENNLIKILKPLFNLKGNPNAKVLLNPTGIYKKRRKLIDSSTKTRLGCSSKNGNLAKKPKSKTMAIEELEIMEDDIIVMCCAGSKRDFIPLLDWDGQEINFKAELNASNSEYRPDDLTPFINEKTWREYVAENQPNLYINLTEAFLLYKSETYLKLYMAFRDNFYILSAGWGIVKANYRIPKYDITFSDNGLQNTKRVKPDPFFDLKDHNQLIANEKQRIIFLGGFQYHYQFVLLTSHLPNEKIICFSSRNYPQIPRDENFHPYFTNKKGQKWYYTLAEELVHKRLQLNFR